MHNFVSACDHGNAKKLQSDWTRLYEVLEQLDV